MRKTFLPWLLLPALAACASQRPADLVFRNGPVYTMAQAVSKVASVAVAQGRIVYAGSESGLSRWIGPRTKVIDLGGRTLLPGFHDSHVHLLEGGIALSECRLSGLATQDEVLAAVRRCAAQSPAGSEWLRGGGWELPVFPGANPHKSLLDSAVPDRPALLTGADGHSAWANSRALALAGITRDTPDPPRGRIEHDADGEPSGTLREAAVGLVSRLVPERTAQDDLDGLRRGLREAARFGITSIQDASVGEKELRAYRDLDRRGELTVRTVAALHVDPEKGIADLPRLVALRRESPGDRGHRLRILAAKLFVDGVIESHTAALLEPYLDTPGDHGPVNWPPEALDRIVAALDHEGFQVHIHAIGDRAVRMSLDAFEKAAAANGRRDSRHQIAHLELIDPQDIPRFRSLGVIANFQAFWAIEDAYIKDLTVPVLGPERSRRLYPLGSVAHTGAVLACGSDWPVTSLNPLDAIQVGVTRRDPAGDPGPAWLPDQLVDRSAMLACYTRNGTYANFEDAETGTIETGKAADLIVLDRDPFTVPAAEIARIRVLLTLLEGRETWRDPESWDRILK